MTQDAILERHFREVGNISPAEASIMYKIRSMTSNIWRLRNNRGLNIRSEVRKDVAGQRYTRYFLEK